MKYNNYNTLKYNAKLSNKIECDTKEFDIDFPTYATHTVQQLFSFSLLPVELNLPEQVLANFNSQAVFYPFLFSSFFSR